MNVLIGVSEMGDKKIKSFISLLEPLESTTSWLLLGQMSRKGFIKTRFPVEFHWLQGCQKCSYLMLNLAIFHQKRKIIIKREA